MKAITLWQPWATAIALGHKTIETRSWSTKYRGPLAIHAARRWTRKQQDFASVERAFGRLPSRIPLGMIVATCQLVDVFPTEEMVTEIGAVEKIYGDYTVGRFAWVLNDIKALPEPIEFAGRQGFFNVPDSLLRAT